VNLKAAESYSYWKLFEAVAIPHFPSVNLDCFVEQIDITYKDELIAQGFHARRCDQDSRFGHNRTFESASCSCVTSERLAVKISQESHSAFYCCYNRRDPRLVVVLFLVVFWKIQETAKTELATV
jgi:hypothetical protein